jgi:hypothetical protein
MPETALMALTLALMLDAEMRCERSSLSLRS